MVLLTFGSGEPLPIDNVVVRSVDHDLKGLLTGNARAPRPSLPGQVRLYLHAGMCRAVAEEIELRRPRVVHATLARMAPYLPISSGLHSHLDLIDSLAANMASRGRQAGLAGIPFSLEGRLLRGYERRAAAAADSCSVVTEADRDHLGLPAYRVAVVPNGVDLEAFAFEEPWSRPPAILFFGNLGYFHNVGPAEYVAREVFPALRARVPEARLRLVGARPARRIRRIESPPEIELRADVSDLAGELHQASAAVLPLASGTGMKNKVLEAFAAGLPVVTNRLGIDGVTGAEAGTHYLEAETADAQADAAARLLSDGSERCRIATAARDLVIDRYSWPRQVERLLELYGTSLAKGS